MSIKNKYILGLLWIVLCISCRGIRNIHTPTKREIKRAMKYSTSEYKMNNNNNYYRTYYRGQK